ncbi:MAG: hypothetical protein ACP5MZ_02575 [Candidatus Micrarchaeia archaeon]
MNFSMTFSDRIGLKSASTEEKAGASVTRAVYDAIRYDDEFRKESFAMFEEKRYGELQLAIKDLLANEAARLLPDATFYIDGLGRSAGLAGKLGALASAQSAGERAENMALALDKVGDGELDLVACYCEAYSRFEIEMGLYRELKREQGVSAHSQISEV